VTRTHKRILVRLAELVQVPVLTTNTGKGAFPENHPLSLGASVVSAPKMMFHFLKNVDCVVAMGSSLTRNHWAPQVPPGKTILHCTNDAGDINKEFPTKAAMLGDAKLMLEALIGEIGNKKRTSDNVADEVQAVRKEWRKEWASELTSSEEPINQYRRQRSMHAVDQENTIITHDRAARASMVAFWECLFPGGYSRLGQNDAIGSWSWFDHGCKLANPDKLCINVMGDASIGMVGMDIETAARNRIGILTIVFNNGVMAESRMAWWPSEYGRQNWVATSESRALSARGLNASKSQMHSCRH
jgi:acetolactate synthase-1/2/3 large subunit